MTPRQLRNQARQDQVEAMQRNWIEQMSSVRLYRLMSDAVVWMEANDPHRDGPPLLVPADIAHEAITCLVIRLSGELQKRIAEANDPDTQRGQTAEEGRNDD